MRLGVNEVAPQRERTCHGAVSDHARYRRSLFLTNRQKPRCELSRHITIEVYEIDDPLAKQGREEQRGVIGRLSKPFRLLDKRARLCHGSLGFGSAISLDM